MNSMARQAPAVRLPVRRSRAVGAVLAAVALAGAAVLYAWWLLGAGQGVIPALAGSSAWLAAVGLPLPRMNAESALIYRLRFIPQ